MCFKNTLSAIRLRLLLSLLLLELHVAMVHHCTRKLVYATFLVSVETQDVNSILWKQREREREIKSSIYSLSTAIHPVE